MVRKSRLRSLLLRLQYSWGKHLGLKTILIFRSYHPATVIFTIGSSPRVDTKLHCSPTTKPRCNVSHEPTHSVRHTHVRSVKGRSWTSATRRCAVQTTSGCRANFCLYLKTARN